MEHIALTQYLNDERKLLNKWSAALVEVQADMAELRARLEGLDIALNEGEALEATEDGTTPPLH